MNFLQLCQRLRQECGISGTGPTTTSGQVGELAEIVSWVNSAYEDIQNLHTQWRFRIEDFSQTLTASVNEYTPADLSITDLLMWKKDDVRIYLNAADEMQIQFLPWQTFKQSYLIGTIIEERPSVFSVKPNNSIVFWPTPNDTYTVVGEYVKATDTLSGDTDTPIFPADYHMAIVWRALRMYAGLLAAPEKTMHSDNEYRRVMRAMEASQLPEMIWGQPLT